MPGSWLNIVGADNFKLALPTLPPLRPSRQMACENCFPSLLGLAQNRSHWVKSIPSLHFLRVTCSFTENSHKVGYKLSNFAIHL